jgi:hypothetical protein
MQRYVPVAITITALFLPLILQQGYSDIGPYERTLTLKITNTKTGDVKTKVWNFKEWTFQEPSVDVSDFMVKKMKKVFNTETFSFSLSSKVYEGEWLHFKVELTETPILLGRGFTVKFV